MGQYLQTFTERDWSSFFLNQENNLYVLWFVSCQLVHLFHTAWSPLAPGKEETHPSEKQNVSSLLYTWVVYNERGRVSLKRHTQKKILSLQTQGHISWQVWTGLSPIICFSMSKNGLWRFLPPLPICLKENKPAFKQSALAFCLTYLTTQWE